MKIISLGIPFGPVLMAFLVAPLPTFAQNAFVAIEDGKVSLVKRVLNHPMVEVDGKLVATSARQFDLSRATVYRSGLVSLNGVQLNTYHFRDATASLHVSGQLKSDTSFKNCFIVLEVFRPQSTRLICYEIPNLTAGASIDIDLVFPLEEKIEKAGTERRYRIHLFSDGIELLHSGMRADYLSFQKKKTEELLAGKSRDFPAIASRMVTAAYPDELKKQKLVGSASVRCVINARGEATSFELEKASHPAFGSAALAALSKWQFDPAIRNRHFVESTLVIPFKFEPPD